MSENLKDLTVLYNAGKFLELQTKLNKIFEDPKQKNNRNLLKLRLLNYNQLGNENICIELSKIFFQVHNLDFETVILFYLNTEKLKKLNIFYENYTKLLKNINFDYLVKNKKTESLINFFLSKNENELALLTIKILLKKKSDDLKLIYYLVGKVFYSFRKYRQSLYWFLKLKNIDNKNYYLLIEIGNIYNLLRDKSNSIKYLKKASQIDDLKPRSYKILSTIYDYQVEIDHFNEMLKYSIENNEKDKDVHLLNFAISKAYEDKKDYQSACFFFKKANNQKKQFFSKNVDVFKGEINFFYNLYKNKNNFIFNKSASDIKPIFIVGLPRSGTTIIDRILSSNPDVVSYGESSMFSNQFKHFFDIYDPNQALKDFENFGDKEALGFQELYLEKVHKKKNFKIFIDKMPFNYLYIPLIKKIFPNSIIILTKRDLRDVGLSLLKNHFADTKLNFVYSEQDIIEYFKLYKKITLLYYEIYREYFYEINYSELVSNPKNEISKLFHICDYKTTVNNDLLSSVSNNYIADTVSVNQVNKEIYTSSNFIYKKYENCLGDFFSKVIKI